MHSLMSISAILICSYACSEHKFSGAVRAAYAPGIAPVETTPDVEPLVVPPMVVPSAEDTPTPIVAPVEVDDPKTPAPLATDPRVTVPPVIPSEENAPIFGLCEKYPDRHIEATLYKVAENIDRLPDFTGMSALNTFCMKNIDIFDRNFKEGFPGVEEMIEWFALDIRFTLTAPVDGNYKINLNSDDGSILFIDGQIVINNDGIHPQKRLTNDKVTLTKGPHSVQIKYYQGPRYRIALEMFWAIPGDSIVTPVPDIYISKP